MRPVLAGGKLGRGLAVAAHAEPIDTGLEGSQAALDAAHLLLDGGEIRHAFHRSPESLVYEPLELSQPIRDLRQLLDPPSGALRRGAQYLDTAIHRGSDVLEGGLTVADDVVEVGTGLAFAVDVAIAAVNGDSKAPASQPPPNGRG